MGLAARRLSATDTARTKMVMMTPTVASLVVAIPSHSSPVVRRCVSRLARSTHLVGYFGIAKRLPLGHRGRKRRQDTTTIPPSGLQLVLSQVVTPRAIQASGVRRSLTPLASAVQLAAVRVEAHIVALTLRLHDRSAESP